MNQVSIIFYYWIAIIAVCLGTKYAGYGDNNIVMLKVIILITILYVGIIMVFNKKQKVPKKNQTKSIKENNKLKK